MKAILQVKVNNIEGYILKEAEALLANLGAFADGSDEVILELDRGELLYNAVFRLDIAGEHWMTEGFSRDMRDALEDAYLKMLNLLDSFKAVQSSQQVIDDIEAKSGRAVI